MTNLTLSLRAADGSTSSLVVPFEVVAVQPPSEPEAPVNGLPAGVTLQDIDGGPGYSARFASPMPSDPSFFPIAVWYEGTHTQAEIDKDKANGLNTYLMLTDDSNLPLIRQNGMYAFTPGRMKNFGSETVGYITGDEVDMSGAGWWGAPTPEQFKTLESQLTYLPKDGRARITNFGKGIIFNGNDAEASRMLRDYQDFISADIYWFTDADTWGLNQGGKLLGLNRDLTAAENRRASNYGVVVRKLRRLLGNSKPVWGFTEVGGPFPQNKTAASYIKPEQARAATWSQIIAGARGITYFNHSFGGPAISQHALREAYYAPVAAVVAAANAQIKRLAPVLNGPDAIGLVSTPASVDLLAKWNDGKPYVFAHNRVNAATTATFSVTGAGNGVVTVEDENRTIQMVGGKFTDTFADGNAVHIYRL